jgi:hypothetical protein
MNKPLTRPNCPECGTPMGKREKRWSGRHKKQLWLCSKCGRTKLTPLEGEDNDNGTGHKPPRLASTAPTPKLTIKPTNTPTTTTKGLKLCDGNYAYDNIKRHCKMSENGHCLKGYYPFSCPKYKRDEWEALPTS